MPGRKTSGAIAVRELEVEDAFRAFPEILAESLGFDFELSIIARQKDLPSGRLDLLAVGQRRLFLIELKVEPYAPDFLTQVLGYRRDLIDLQQAGDLIAGPIDTILLVTAAPASAYAECTEQGVALRQYSPAAVLEAFYTRMAALSNFLTVRPVDLGVWNIHLINRVLYALPEHNTVTGLAANLTTSANTTRNHLRFAQQLGLVRQIGRRWFLTDLGVQYVQAREPCLPEDAVAEAQLQILRSHIVSDPFASRIIFGIYSLVEAVFILARNTYPVDMDDLTAWYRDTVGKRFDWATPRSAFLGANAYANFAVELGLLAKVGRKLLLTPAGFRFVLMLQLHKGIKLVDALQPS